MKHLHIEPSPIPELKKLQTFKSAAHAIGVPYYKIQRAANKGLIPTYCMGDSTRYVRLIDILAFLKCSDPVSNDEVLS